MVAFIRSSKKGWECIKCGKRWMYDELSRDGRCPHCNDIVKKVPNAR